MFDLLMVVLLAVMFLAAAGYIRVCDALIEPPGGAEEKPE